MSEVSVDVLAAQVRDAVIEFFADSAARGRGDDGIFGRREAALAALDALVARVTEAERELVERKAVYEHAYEGLRVELTAKLLEREAALADARNALERLPNEIQAAKHNAGIAMAECARDADWDLEAYYRAKGEGLAEAERIAREVCDRCST